VLVDGRTRRRNVYDKKSQLYAEDNTGKGINPLHLGVVTDIPQTHFPDLDLNSGNIRCGLEIMFHSQLYPLVDTV